ncbi:LacI family DNA-binding transcriptional regulator [Erwiniaceae bacterium BAC15a-03b]|uniref:LacI family DNA-binding transcriptional regulator n=1 Tax=Winslowiella arboricola TaxID=2978220 RepID=A0A9J6PJR1_9GAMM|nr:LacI family DNA-binding transcriptional regulator [Winslowiella arboricola]MCU5774093.1 LacI family DNA-binding transcriptional regulator [Winslowiella arboricola]MCU5776974.1 LacI family DNA-binding transcriptional regulator [Winslowiella arboricola]
MTTMLDVANKAGVSKATVSRVLAGNSYVSKTTKDRVFKAIEETGYRPNLLARNLATRKSQSIGLVVTNTLYHGPYFSELLFQTATLTENHGRQLILADGKHSAEEERQAIQFLLDLRCDAIIIYPRFLTPAEMDEIIEQHQQPIMVVNRKLERHPDNCVWAEHQQDSVSAINYLIAQGHREIAFICGSQGSPTSESRYAGYQQALQENHIAWEAARVVQGDWTPDSGRVAAETLLARGVSFSALVASNDDMATGAARAFYQAGIAVPQQISLLSFDDIPMASFYIPTLTTVHVPVAEMIKDTLDRLVNLLEGQPNPPLTPLRGQLIIRESVIPAIN